MITELISFYLFRERNQKNAIPGVILRIKKKKKRGLQRNRGFDLELNKK